MATAPDYHRKKNFLDNNPDRTDHGAINDELDNVATSIDAIIANQVLLQADDGTLKAGTVGVTQLTPDAQAELSRPGPEGPQGPDGPEGPEGPDGAKGDVGASFDADVRGVDSERSAHDAAEKGFSFLAIDTGLLYFKLSAQVADWSTGYTFGKGEKGDPGPRGIQGQRGIQGLRGPQGEEGPPGIQGVPGQNGTVDYGRVILNDVTDDQEVQGGFAARSLSGSVSAAAPVFTFSGAAARILPNNNRLRIDDGGSTPALIDLELANVRTSGTGAGETGVKLANGVDIGTLFDPAGSAASKIAGIATPTASASLAGKTQIFVSLSLVNNKLVIGVSTT